jgi:predicted NBD/HSP70 family sugar kinase
MKISFIISPLSYHKTIEILFRLCLPVLGSGIINNMTGAVIGIDIGGTKIRGALWNGKKVLKTVEFATAKNLAEFRSNLISLIKFLGRTGKIAVGAAGIVNKTSLVASRNIPYIKNFDFSKIAGLDFDGKILLDNDARCFARTEYSLLSPIDKKMIFFITLGTGVGRAVGRNGKILRIKKFEHPENWEKEYQKLRDSENDESLAKYLDKKITNLTSSYKPQLIIFGGGVSRRKGLFMKLKKLLKLPIANSKFGANSVAVGAAMLF